MSGKKWKKGEKERKEKNTFIHRRTIEFRVLGNLCEKGIKKCALRYNVCLYANCHAENTYGTQQSVFSIIPSFFCKRRDVHTYCRYVHKVYIVKSFLHLNEEDEKNGCCCVVCFVVFFLCCLFVRCFLYLVFKFIVRFIMWAHVNMWC